MYVIQEEHKQFLISFGNRIKELRISQGLTKRQLAFEMNTSPRFIRSIELGETNMTATTFLKLSSALNIPLHELVAFHDSNSKR